MILLLLLVTAGQVALGQVEADQTGRIISALKQNQYEEALQLAQDELSRFPASPQLWTLRGMALAGQGNVSEALRSYQQALKSSPNYLAALEGASQLLYHNHDQRAVFFLDKIVNLRPEDQVAHAMLGSLAFSRGDCKTAVRHFELSRDQLASHPAAMIQDAGCLAQVDQISKSISILQSLLKAEPGNFVARRALAAVQLKAGTPQDAIETLSPLLKAPDLDTPTARLAAAAYEANQDTPHAVKMLHDAIVRDPSNVGLYTDFANIAFTHQSFQAGVAMVDAGLKARPRSAALYLVRGVLYAQLALYDKAVADFEMAQKLDPRQAFSAAAGDLLASEGKVPLTHGLIDLQRRLSKNPNDAFLWSLEASIISEKDPAPGTPAFSEAMYAAKKAITLQPKLASAYDVLAKLYQDAGNTNQAIRECRNAFHYDPKDQTALYHLIMMLRKNDKKNEVPAMVKQLAKLRQEATRKEAENNRYKLIIEPDDSTKAGAQGDHN